MDLLRTISELDFYSLCKVVIIASLPVIAWTALWFKKDQEESKNLLMVFFLGTLTVLPFLALEFFWSTHPDLDIYNLINRNITNLSIAYVMTYMVAGALEEIVKGVVIYYIDFSSVEIRTINNCIRYNLLVALGFAFSENLLYFYNNLGADGFSSVVMYRSIFTVCAHMVFSSITGYYFGISKFSDSIFKQAEFEGNTHLLLKRLAFYLEKDVRSVVSALRFWEGILIAMLLHASFNISLVSGHIWIASSIVAGGFFYVRYLNHRKAGNLVLAMTGVQKKSMMALRDEEVVLELMGMWMNQKKYNEVIEVCTRLLERDPDNKVVKLFEAKAHDNIELSRKLSEILKNVKVN